MKKQFALIVLVFTFFANYSYSQFQLNTPYNPTVVCDHCPQYSAESMLLLKNNYQPTIKQLNYSVPINYNIKTSQLPLGSIGNKMKKQVSSNNPASFIPNGSGHGNVLELSNPAQTNQDVEFWLLFLRNYEGGAQLYLDFTGPENTTGTVSVPGLSWSQAFTVTPGTITRVTIPDGAQLLNYGTIQNLGVHVVSAKKITVYGANKITWSTDSFLGIPVSVLGTSYLALSYSGLDDYTQYASTVGIVSPYDNNVITITPSVATQNGQSAGVPFNITLNQGQTYEVAASGYRADISGTFIQSSLPVAVFAGAGCVNIPVGFVACDHICEQMPPISSYGLEFVTRPLAGRTGGDTWRFMASQNNTVLRINGSVVATLNFGGFYECMLSVASHVVADKPILAMQYSNGVYWDYTTGDPFSMLCPPFEQFLDNYTFATPAFGFDANYINIAVSTAGVGGMKLDGVAMSPAAFTPIPGTSFSSASFPTIINTTYNVTNSDGFPFGLWVYGFTQADSYGYPGGSGYGAINAGGGPVVNLTPATINNFFCTTIPTTQDIEITATIADSISPFVQSGILYYRTVGTSTYSSTPMSLVSGITYRGTIPASFTTYPGVQFYILASDGQTITTSPALDPANNPYMIGVDNPPPVTNHIPVASAPLGIDIPISANVTDVTDYVQSVKLFYRKTGGTPIYNELAMTFVSGSTYSATIPGAQMTAQGIDYYIQSTDNYGISCSSGSSDAPYVILAITCANPTNGGAIAANQSGGNPFNPALITSTATLSGYTGTLEYKWQRATSFSPFIIWQDLANTNADTYDPGTITQTTKYRRLVKVTCENTWLESNIVTMTISYTPFIWNGNAYPTGDSCFVLTPDEFGQDGSVWYQNYMSLNYDFDLSFNVFLGYDDDGADGIAFVLQPLSTGAGGAGGGIGYYGISPSIAVEYDTWENDDPSEDHISIQPNGDVSTNSSSMGLAIMPNIEDGLWHNTRITWEHATKTLRVYWEGTLKLSLTNDLATNFFGGNPNVYWGMTGATGAAKNLQEFCVTTQTFQEALFNVSQTNITCHNDNNASATASLLFGDVTFDGWYQGVNLFSSSLSISGLAAGTYTAKAHNSLGQTSQQDVIIINPDAVTFTTNVVQVSCNGCSDGQIIVNATGGNGTYYYSMYPFGSYQFSNVFSGLPSGSYKLRVFDGNYCYSDTQTVNFVLLCTNPANGGSISGDQNICNVNPPATLASVSPASGQTGTLEYKWQYSVAPFSVWNDISSSNVEDLSFLSPVTQTTKYKRLARVDCMPDWSGALESNVATLTNNTTVIVTNNMNDGVGSLRYAINNVCNNGYILFDAGIDGQTIALATGAITINKNITFDNCSHSAGITIMGVGDNFIINSGKSLTINACSKITVRGRIQNNAGVSGLVLASGASFIYDFCELPATAQRTLNYGWHLFGSPFKQSAGATRANVTPASGSQLLPYTNGSAWGLNITSPYYFLQPTVGYALKPNAGFTASLSGMLFCSTCLPCPCDYSVSLTYSGVASDKSWNLLANPYTSYLNWNLLGKTNLSNTLYFWDNALNAGTPTTNASYFRTYNASNGVGVPAGTQPYIAPFQGFFVKALVANPKLTFPYAARTHSSASFYKEGGTEILVRLKTETETAIDELVVCKSADAKNAFEEFDSEKMFNGLPIEMYTQTSGGEKLIINTIDNTNTVIPIGINITNGSKAKITAFGLESAEHVYLEDRLKGKLISLSENTAYEFDFSSEAILERFFIRFGDINTPLSNSDVKVYTNEHQLNIIAQTGEEIQQVEVYSLTGACVYSSKLSGSNVFNSTLDLSADIYLVRVKTSLATQNVKLNWK